MKKISVILALMALFFADLALAAGAVATSVIGAVQVQTGTASPRAVRTGDEFAQGDTVSTGPNSSVVLKFDDGQVAALTSNSRMTITAYQYNPANESGNMLLSLVTGGMRAITGLIGRKAPSQVAYRAATATIGIRGTDGTIVTNGTDVLVTVEEGVMVLTAGSDVLVINGKEAVLYRPGQAPIQGTIGSVLPRAPQAFRDAIAQMGGIDALIRNASPGIPRGQPGQPPGQPPGPPGPPPGQVGGPQGGGGGGGGGGNASGS